VSTNVRAAELAMLAAADRGEYDQAEQVWDISQIALADYDGFISVLRAYLDESGTHDGSPVMTVAGYIARPKVWRDWTRRWGRALGPIRVYHAVDAQNLAGEFRGWTPEEVAKMVKKLLPIIAETKGVGGFAVGMDLRVFEQAVHGREDLRKVFGTPYIACFHQAVRLVHNVLNQTGYNERIAFIHETNNFETEALKAFGWIKKNNLQNDRMMSLTFAGKQDYPPLQAADILAYESNKRLRDPSAPPRRPWDALRGPQFAVRYGSSDVGGLIAALENLNAGN
jgi:hypothetical protein